MMEWRRDWRLDRYVADEDDSGQCYDYDNWDLRINSDGRVSRHTEQSVYLPDYCSSFTINFANCPVQFRKLYIKRNSGEVIYTVIHGDPQCIVYVGKNKRA